MKNSKYIVILLLGILTLNSCNEWLSISPKTEITQKELFKTQRGFEEAIIGLYIQLKDANAYGGQLTMTTLEYLVNSWDTQANTTQQFFAYHNYSHSSCESNIRQIFDQLYKIIAGANAVLEYVDNAYNDGVFESENAYCVIKGEVLGIRALCHLDILRLFGPVPQLADNSAILPYSRTVSSIATKPISYSEYCKLLLKDIEASVDLLENNDPIYNVSVVATSNFFSARHLRMNYYAIKGLEARANLYMGKKEAAYAAANAVINPPEGKKEFTLGVMSDLENEDYSFKSEHLFAIHNYKLYSVYDNSFGNGSLKKGTNEAIIGDELFGSTGTDIRELKLWSLINLKDGSSAYIINKYFAEEPSKNDKGIQDFRIPILRLSEMYLIAAETAPIGEAQKYWNLFQDARGVANSELTEANRLLQIVKEYRKEFYAEGQMFYVHKRLNSSKNDILFFPSSSSVLLNYVLPLPKSEI